MRGAPSAPAIVLLGAKLRPGGAPGPALVRRVERAARLYAGGAAAFIIATGGPAGARPTEARVMRDLLAAAGTPPGAVIEEDRARDTFENALFSRAILRARGLGPAIVVTDGAHLPRALMLFRLLGVAATGAAAVRSDPRTPTGAVLREALALPRDLARGLAARVRGR